MVPRRGRDRGWRMTGSAHRLEESREGSRLDEIIFDTRGSAEGGQPRLSPGWSQNGPQTHPWRIYGHAHFTRENTGKSAHDGVNKVSSNSSKNRPKSRFTRENTV